MTRKKIKNVLKNAGEKVRTPSVTSTIGSAKKPGGVFSAPNGHAVIVVGRNKIVLSPDEIFDVVTMLTTWLAFRTNRVKVNTETK